MEARENNSVHAHMRPTTHLAMRRFGLGTLCLVGAVWSACSSPPPGVVDVVDDTPEEEVRSFTVTFDVNAEDAEAGPQSQTISAPSTTLETLPAEPTRPGHLFVGWNTEPDGSGMAFTEDTPVEEDITVYAQWGRRLFFRFPAGLTLLTPMEADGESGRSTTLNVEVSGFLHPEEADEVALEVHPVRGLSFLVEEGTRFGSARSFRLGIEYDGETAFFETSVALRFQLQKLPEAYAEETHTFHISVVDGLRETSAIPVHQANLALFNSYAASSGGLSKHYRLTQHVELPQATPPPWGRPSNWKPIGNFAAPFTGSFDGGGFTLSRLTIDNSMWKGWVVDQNFFNQQALFGYIGEGARVEHVGLTNVNIVGEQHIGSLAGVNSGTVRNCYATGSVSGTDWVGGLVGHNHGGRVENCYVIVGVKANNHAGGVAGSNSGTLQNCMALGPSVIATGPDVGRVAGSNHRVLKNNHAFAELRDGAGNTRWSNLGADKVDGASRAADALQTAGGFPEELRSPPWTYHPGSLPGFLGWGVEMPPHLAR